MKRGAPKSDPEKVRAFVERGRRSSAESLKPGRPSADRPAERSIVERRKRLGFTPASKEQRAKVAGEPCVVCMGGLVKCDPAHLAPRALGGCDDPLCVVALCRGCHRQLDQHHNLDLLPHLIPRHADEIAHALGHYNGDLIALLQRLTGCRWAPEKEAA